jgi:hypothetical protein
LSAHGLHQSIIETPAERRVVRVDERRSFRWTKCVLDLPADRAA